MSSKRMEPFYQHTELLRCPLCFESMERGEGCLRCQKGHTFSLSAKGYGDFVPQSKASQYDASLFEARRRIIEGAFYEPLKASLHALLRQYASKGTLLDAGCGEGSFLKALVTEQHTAIGIDLAREGIRLAAKGGNSLLWFVADLCKLPVKDNSTDCLLNILSPAFYEEFARALGQEGVLIKVIPEAAYLQEIRLLAREQLRHESYSNVPVLERFKVYFTVIEDIELKHSFSLTQQEVADFVTMTPLAAYIDKQKLPMEQLQKITVHLRVLVGKAKKE